MAAGRRDDRRRGCLLGLCDLSCHFLKISLVPDLIRSHSLLLLPLLHALLCFVVGLLC